MPNQVLRFLAYLWASPNTFFGIAIGLLLAGRFQLIDGVIEIHGRRIKKALLALPQPAAAMTMGHVVFGQDTGELAVTRIHERVHVRQYERWGIAFIPAYLVASFYLFVKQKLTGQGDWYRGNPFEVEAYAVDDPAQRRS